MTALPPSTKKKFKLELPHGWVERVSRRKPDKVYYFNTITHASTWTVPGPKEHQHKKPSSGSRRPSSTSKAHIPPQASYTSRDFASPVENKKQPSDQSKTDFVSLKRKLNHDAISDETPRFSPIPFEDEEARKAPASEAQIRKGSSFASSSSLKRFPKGSFDANRCRSKSVPSHSASSAKTCSPITPPVKDTAKGLQQGKVLLVTRKTKIVEPSKGLPLSPRSIVKKSRRKEQKNRRAATGVRNSDGDVSTPQVSIPVKCKPTWASKSSKKADAERQQIPLTTYSEENLSVESENRVPTVDTKGIFIVVDTNVFLNSLSFVEELKDNFLEGHGRPTLVIPWIVQHELDRLKDGKQGSDLKDVRIHYKHSLLNKAKTAISFINNCLSNKHPRVIGQSIQDCSETDRQVYTRNNDDKILQCCLQYQQKEKNATIVLLTGDMSFRNKAIVSSTPAFSEKEIISGLLTMWEGSAEKIETPQTKVKATNPRKASRNISTDSPMLPCTPSVPSKVRKKSNEATSILVDDILCEIKTVLRKPLSVILETEMEEAFGDLWLQIIIKKPPWTFLDILDCFKKHWMAVFGLIFPNRCTQNQMLQLVDFFKAKSGLGANLNSTRQLLNQALQLLQLFKTHSNYNDALTLPIQQLINLQQKCSNSTTEIEPQLTSPSPTSSRTLPGNPVNQSTSQFTPANNATRASTNTIRSSTKRTRSLPANGQKHFRSTTYPNVSSKWPGTVDINLNSTKVSTTKVKMKRGNVKSVQRKKQEKTEKGQEVSEKDNERTCLKLKGINGIPKTTAVVTKTTMVLPKSTVVVPKPTIVVPTEAVVEPEAFSPVEAMDTSESDLTRSHSTDGPSLSFDANVSQGQFNHESTSTHPAIWSDNSEIVMTVLNKAFVKACNMCNTLTERLQINRPEAATMLRFLLPYLERHVFALDNIVKSTINNELISSRTHLYQELIDAIDIFFKDTEVNEDGSGLSFEMIQEFLKEPNNQEVIRVGLEQYQGLVNVCRTLGDELVKLQ